MVMDYVCRLLPHVGVTSPRGRDRQSRQFDGRMSRDAIGGAMEFTIAAGIRYNINMLQQRAGFPSDGCAMR
jgi:hypothetical protein